MELRQYEPRRSYARASVAGGLVFLAGEAAYADHEVVGDDITTQTIQVFENIKSTLDVYELDFGDLVRMDVFLGSGDDKVGFLEVMATYLPDGSPPGALLTVAGFAHEGVLVEVECIAAKR